MKEIGRVILVTGTPAVGKTAVSRLLASRLDAIHVDLTKLVEREKLTNGMDRVRKTFIADNVKVSKRVQETIRSSQRDIVIDGHYAVDVVAAKDVYVVFVLRRDPEELKGLMENRGFEGNKLWENLAAEILDVCLWDAISAYGPDKVCELDASGESVERIAEDIIAVLEKRKRCEVGIVDWLGKLEKHGRLGDFLKP